MSEDLKALSVEPDQPLTQGTSTVYRLFEAFIALREKNERQQTLVWLPSIFSPRTQTSAKRSSPTYRRSI